MDWESTYRAPGMSDREFFARQLAGVEIVDCATVKSVFYAACRNPREPDSVWAIVAPLKRIRRQTDDPATNFAYKLAHEDRGPRQKNCPQRILNLLSETEAQWALDWRSRCRYSLAMRKRPDLHAGDHVHFGVGIVLQDGEEYNRFVYCKGSTFQGFRTGTNCIISNWRALPYTVEANGF